MCHHRDTEDQVKIRHFEAENIPETEEERADEEICEDSAREILKEAKGEDLVRGVQSLGAEMEEVESEEERVEVSK